MALIEGLDTIEDFITREEHDALLARIESQPWDLSLSRRTQQYGFVYAHKGASLDASSWLGPLPSWLQVLALRLKSENWFHDEPDQAILNEYEPGQGIAAHVDAPHLFGPSVASLSLLSPALMEFRRVGAPRDEEKTTLWLAPRSLLVMRGEARSNWTHAMPARKTDRVEGQLVARKRRLSVTFRTVTKAPAPS